MQTDDIKLLKDAINVGEKSLLNFIQSHLNQKEKTLKKLKAVEDSLESKLVDKMKHKRNLTQSLNEASEIEQPDSKATKSDENAQSQSNKPDERKNVLGESDSEPPKTEMKESSDQDIKISSDSQEKSDDGDTKSQIKIADIKAEIQADKSELDVSSSDLDQGGNQTMVTSQDPTTERKNEDFSQHNLTTSTTLDGSDNSTVLSEKSQTEEKKEFSSDTNEQNKPNENQKTLSTNQDISYENFQSPKIGKSTPMGQNAQNITSSNQTVERTAEIGQPATNQESISFQSQTHEIYGNKVSNNAFQFIRV